MFWVTGWYPKKRLQTAQKQTLTSKHSVVERKCHFQTIICNGSMFILEHIIYLHDSGNSFIVYRKMSVLSPSVGQRCHLSMFFLHAPQSTWTTLQRLKDSEISRRGIQRSHIDSTSRPELAEMPKQKESFHYYRC